MPPSRRYTDEEVHTIFERAAARQEEAQRAEYASRSGLSLEELQEIGREAGIDPTHIAEVAHALGRGNVGGMNEANTAFLGIPTRIEKTRRVVGQLNDAEWEQVVLEMRQIFGRDGIAGELGKVREWTVRSSVGKSDRSVKVSVKPEGGDSLITISQEMKGQAMGFSIGTGVYVLMALVMMLIDFVTAGDGPPLGASLMLLAMAALFFGGAQVGTRMSASRQRSRFERALDRIEQIAAQPSVETEPSQAMETTPAIDLGALHDDESSEVRRPTSERTRS